MNDTVVSLATISGECWTDSTHPFLETEEEETLTLAYSFPQNRYVGWRRVVLMYWCSRQKKNEDKWLLLAEELS